MTKVNDLAQRDPYTRTVADFIEKYIIRAWWFAICIGCGLGGMSGRNDWEWWQGPLWVTGFTFAAVLLHMFTSLPKIRRLVYYAKQQGAHEGRWH